ncbi:RHS repeat domain-containing protein [Dyadobacter psychrotolerans]|uniref:RHS repeat domain-containing protein n=1 Tax=Dyadobacter psychrotolerans TaxID=2541721 RepID=UPI0014052C64|nr:RHS repeat-associated core domain-containing protein [Dyadobacter psychrotolerans]
MGSIVTVTNSSAAIEAQQSFDAWGRRRIFDTWAIFGPTETVPNIPVWLYRGYTGHEHLDRFGLINMNGRLYDPVLGRMLSPDNYISDAGFSQDYNRYSYARNNPLLYTDPDGNMPWITMAIGAAIGGVINGYTYAIQGKGFFNGFWRGAITGAIAGLTGYYAPIGAIPGLAYGAASGAVTGGVGAALNGNNIWKGVAMGAALGGISGGISGGIEAHKLGANWLTGARPDHYSLASDALVSGGTPATYSDEYLYKLKNETWEEIGPGGRMTMDPAKIDRGYTMGTDGVITTPDKIRALAYTKSTPWKHGYSSKIFFGKAAFSSREQLASTMAHEFGHVTFANSVLYNMSKWELTNSIADNEGHLAIYQMQNRLIEINGWQKIGSPYPLGREPVNMELYKLIKHLARPVTFPR